MNIVNQFSCACGQIHRCGVEKAVIGKDALLQAAPLLDGYGRVLIVSDRNTRPLCVPALLCALSASHIKADEACFDGAGLVVPDEKATEFIISRVAPDTKALVGVGSGVINDLCKYASYLKGLPYMIIATAPSMDGFASNGAAMIADGMKVTYSAQVPRFIIGDTELLKTAPLEMISAGIGDIIGKLSCLNDWKLSALITGEAFCQTIFNQTMAEVDVCVKNTAGCMRREPEALGRLFESLVSVGVLMAYLGTSRPASGAEHHIAHFMEITGIVFDRPYYPHGMDVGYATMITAALRRRLSAEEPSGFAYCGEGEAFLERVARVFGPLAGEVTALQKRAGFYSDARLAEIKSKWRQIRQTLLEAPPAEEIAALLAPAGFKIERFTALYGRQTIIDAIISCKDLKDRYTLFWLLNDVGLLERYANEEYEALCTRR